jgi:hypothetical protein
MTDTPQSAEHSEFGHTLSQASPGAHTPPSHSQPSSGEQIQTHTLAELEGKLQELKEELSAVALEPQTQPDPPQEHVPAQEPVWSEPPQPQFSERPLAQPEDPFSPPPGLFDEQADANAPPSVEVQPPQPDPVSDPEQLPPALIVELLSFRERLETTTREIVEDYNRLLSSYVTQVAPPRSEPAPAEVPHQPPLPDSAPAQPPSEPSEDLAEFDGHVELGVGPFDDILSLSAFEHQVALLPNVLETSVRRFEASHAILDLYLSAPVALISELRTVPGVEFTVRQASGSRLALTFDEES